MTVPFRTHACCKGLKAADDAKAMRAKINCSFLDISGNLCCQLALRQIVGIELDQIEVSHEKQQCGGGLERN